MENISVLRALKEESYKQNGRAQTLQNLLIEEEGAAFFLFKEKDGILVFLEPLVLGSEELKDPDCSLGSCEMRELEEKIKIHSPCLAQGMCRCTYAGIVPASGRWQRTRTLIFV